VAGPQEVVAGRAAAEWVEAVRAAVAAVASQVVEAPQVVGAPRVVEVVAAANAPAADQEVEWVAVAGPLVVVAGQAAADRRADPAVVALRVEAEAPAARVAAQVERAAAADSTHS